MGDLPGDGGAAELKPVALHSTSFLEQNNSLEIGAENWAAADKAAREIIRKVQPTPVSEERRQEVVRYIQRLIRDGLGAEVFSYGSVPLKTYLPDGDIDLTAFGGANGEDTLAEDMKYVLDEEEKNPAAEFLVKDVQLIRAEVKIVKCIVQDIVVDLSFNQIGGLCTLCFLEKVDQLIGKDNLFKRSIILIKAWCYYESRILGAYHGLISTYGLETLVLYIFHFYHSTLDGPLAVLYKFLDYFSKFDWETYCISLNGPIRLSSFPAIVAEMPEDSDRDLLLSRDFLSYCVNMFSVPSRGGDKKSRGFQLKHLNIIDPLKENNNLGRSISKGNFYRIRSAFSYGARKLSRVLMQPQGSIANELPRFFANTMARHGGGQRPDGLDIDQSLISNRPLVAGPVQEVGLSKSCNFEEYYDENAVSTGGFQSSSGKSSQDFLSGIERIQSRENREPCSLDGGQQPKDDDLGARSCRDSNDLTTSGLAGLKLSTAVPNLRTLIPKETVSVTPKPTFAPHLFFAKSKWHDYTVTNESPDSDNLDKCEKNASSSASLSGSDGGGVVTVRSVDDKNQLVDKDEEVASSKARDVISEQKSSLFSGDPSPVDWDQDLENMNGTPESLNSSDLTGDYKRYFEYLQYGRWCYERGFEMHSLPTPPMPTTPYGSKSLWDNLRPPSHYKQNGFSHQLHNNFHPNPTVYAMQQPVLLPGVPFGWEDAAKPRGTGTGTYFPNMVPNVPLQGIHSPAMKGRNQALIRPTGMNGRNVLLSGPNMMDRSSHEFSQPQAPVDKTLMFSPSDSYVTFSPHQNGYPNPNALAFQPEGVVEFELSENSRPQRPVSSSPRTLSGSQRSPNAMSREQDRISLRSSYHLKDEDDFPPLSI